jgi:hypothetical protein
MLASFLQSSPHPVAAKFRSWATGMTSRVESIHRACRAVVRLTRPAVELQEAGSAEARAAKIFSEVKQQAIRVILHSVHNLSESHWASNIQSLYGVAVCQ